MTTYHIYPYQIEWEAQQTLQLPFYTGSMLRGAFGHALKKVSCTRPNTECQACPLKNSCPYTQIFQPQIRQPDLPTPYLIQPYQLEAHQLQAGQTETFGFTLLGEQVNQHLPLILYAWQLALKEGIGKHKQPAKLQKLTLHQQILWQTEIPTLQESEQLLSLKNAQNPQSCLMQIKTPLRLIRYKKIIGAKEINAHYLIDAIQRRLSHLSIYEPALPKLPSNLKDNAEAVGFKAQLKWQDWQRYSNRQHQKMTLGGLVGDIQLTLPEEPQWQPFKQALNLAQYTNLGKNTVFGMGHYQIKRLEDR